MRKIGALAISAVAILVCRRSASLPPPTPVFPAGLLLLQICLRFCPSWLSLFRASLVSQARQWISKNWYEVRRSSHGIGFVEHVGCACAPIPSFAACGLFYPPIAHSDRPLVPLAPVSWSRVYVVCAFFAFVLHFFARLLAWTNRARPCGNFPRSSSLPVRRRSAEAPAPTI